MKLSATTYPCLVALAALLAGSSHGFAIRSFTTKTRSISSRVWVQNDPFQLEDFSRDDYDLEYAYRGDDYDYEYGYDREPLQENRVLIETTNSVLRAMHNSFQNVEEIANTLLKEQPMVALGIFVSAGLVAAYLLGFLILDGCIESWNPNQNGAIPYWDDEILVMTRKLH
jgi:hypothetical protein